MTTCFALARVTIKPARVTLRLVLDIEHYLELLIPRSPWLAGVLRAFLF